MIAKWPSCTFFHCILLFDSTHTKIQNWKNEQEKSSFKCNTISFDCSVLLYMPISMTDRILFIIIGRYLLVCVCVFIFSFKFNNFFSDFVLYCYKWKNNSHRRLCRSIWCVFLQIGTWSEFWFYCIKERARENYTGIDIEQCTTLYHHFRIVLRWKAGRTSTNIHVDNELLVKAKKICQMPLFLLRLQTQSIFDALYK